MPTDSSLVTHPTGPTPVPLAIRRVLSLAVVIGSVLSAGVVALGGWLLTGGFNVVTLVLVALGVVPPALASFFARRVLRKAPTLSLVALGVRVGAVVSFTAVVAALYSMLLLNQTIWAGAQLGVSYVSLPIVTLLVGGISSVCGAVTGGLIAKLKESSDAA